jgi:hypothetical protein
LKYKDRLKEKPKKQNDKDYRLLSNK